MIDKQDITEMKKVVNVSVGGRSFSLDDDAYARLAAYFDHFKTRLDRDTQSAREEVMADLENRIAELFDQGTGGATYRVVNLALVTKVVEQLGMPDGSEEPKRAEPEMESGTRTEERQTGTEAPKFGDGMDFTYNGVQGKSRRRLFRDQDDKKIGGVCAGLAAFLNVDLTLVRIVSLLAILLWGTGLLVYIVLWIVVPAAVSAADKCMMRGLEPTAENMAKFSQKKDAYGK
jgi:phage shock protein PspC (stress-responsive transcriptional regulator)